MVLRYRGVEGAAVGGSQDVAGCSPEVVGTGRGGGDGGEFPRLSPMPGLGTKEGFFVRNFGRPKKRMVRSFFSGTQNEVVEVNLSGGVACS
jgi:hypothetical protein